MSIKKKVSVSLAIQDAMDKMDDQDVRRVPQYKVWAMQAEIHIGSYYEYKKKIFIAKVHDCTADIPCEAVAVIGLIPGNHGCSCELQFHNYYQTGTLGSGSFIAGTGFIVIDGLSTPEEGCQLQWEIQGNKIIFKKKPRVKEITIQCLVRETDEKGFILINENHIDAVSEYIVYMRSKQTIWSATQVKIGVADRMEIKREWNRKCADARAVDDDITPSQRHEITALWNNPASGVGIALWRYNDTYYTISR